MRAVIWAKQLINKYERYISPAAFFTGFLWDNFTLRRIDLWIENLIFVIYLSVAAGVIVLLNTRLAQKYKFLPFVLQFSFGALFSGFFVFYSRSASLATSWPFLLFLAGLLLGNEFFRRKYQRLAFNLSVFFVVLFSYFIFAVPVLLGKMGAWIFVLSGITSLAFMALLLVVIRLVNASGVKQVRRLIAFNTIIIFIAFHVLYFSNIIPPIPLSLKDIGIYHRVSRVSGSPSGGRGAYEVLDEKNRWPRIFEKFNNDIHWVPGAPVYAYSAVFAPTKISAEIFHKWYYFDDKKDDWILASQIGFLISGGRDGGYRGYTMKTNVFPGKWRVDVVTDRGQLVGREKFDIVLSDALPEFKIELK